MTLQDLFFCVCSGCCFAEREGFEPPEQLPVHRISSAARSTTPASFHLRGKITFFFVITQILFSYFLSKALC